MQLSYASVDFYLFYDEPVDMQIWDLLTRIEYRASNTQVTIKACGPLVLNCKLIVENKIKYISCFLHIKHQISNKKYPWAKVADLNPTCIYIYCRNILISCLLVSMIFLYLFRSIWILSSGHGVVYHHGNTQMLRPHVWIPPAVCGVRGGHTYLCHEVSEFYFITYYSIWCLLLHFEFYFCIVFLTDTNIW